MRTSSVAGLAIALILGAAAGAWAGDVLLRPPQDVLAAPDFTTAEAADGTVGRSFRLNTTAVWRSRPVASNLAGGTVTSVEIAAGELADSGDELYHVDLRPVVVAEGEVPAFRELRQGVRGEDVAQLQSLLINLGYYTGEPTGRFSTGVYWATRAWQRDLGIEMDGVVRRGDVVFVPDLPARLALGEEVVVGGVLAGGEPAVHQLDEAPTFTISLPEGQAQLAQVGQRVEIEYADGTWDAEIQEINTNEELGAPIAHLASLDDGPICGDDCAAIPLGEPTLLLSRIHVVPETSGVTVPAAALVTDADGDTGIVDEAGAFVPVTVVESAAGVAVVEGIDAGMLVRVPGDGQS